MTVRRPTAEELGIALDAAQRMHDQDIDPHHLALSLRYLHARCQSLEDLHQLIDRYLRFGMPEHELSELHRHLGRLRESDRAADRERGIDDPLPL